MEDESDFFDTENVTSATECTGLIPTPPLDDEQAEAYSELYDIHKDRPVK